MASRTKWSAWRRQGFTIPDGAEVWAPLALTDEQWANRRQAVYGALARLADGHTVESARAELTSIIETQRRDFPDTNKNRLARVMSFTEGMADPGAGPFIGIWQAFALLLLLIACANIANLLMARGAERSQEYAVRLALGASRRRVFSQTLLEGLLLSILAVIVAMPLTAIGLGLSRASIPASVLRFIPGWAFIRVDVPLFLTTAALGTLAMLFFSFIPALQAMRAHVSDTLRQSGRTMTPGRQRQWLRSGARHHAGGARAGAAVWLRAGDYGRGQDRQRRAGLRQAERACRHHQPARSHVCGRREAAPIPPMA